MNEYYENARDIILRKIDDLKEIELSEFHIRMYVRGMIAGLDISNMLTYKELNELRKECLKEI
jgi:hypothetical protein